MAGLRVAPEARGLHIAKRGLARGLAFALLFVSLSLLAAGCAGGPGETVGTTAQAMTFANDKPAYDYFIGKGLTSVQAAGIVGNLDQESGVDPTAVESGGPGRGIAQWSVGGRWDTDTDDNATWYATMQGATLLSLQLQLDFIWYELTTFSGYGLAALRATTNVTDATSVFETDFEGCGTCDQSTRIAYAKNVLAAFGGDAAAASEEDASGTSDSGIGTPCTVTTTGVSGVCMEATACASLGGHESTPGYCPGPDDVECCTATGAGGIDASADAAHDARDDGHTAPPPPHDAGAHTSHADSGATGGVVDAYVPGRGDGEAPVAEDASSPGASGGCSVTRNGYTDMDAPAWALSLSLALVASRSRRRRELALKA